jgi:hypothetical protein
VGPWTHIRGWVIMRSLCGSSKWWPARSRAPCRVCLIVVSGGHYPGFFKVARVRPVFKSEDSTEFSNYRPISVLPVLSQVFKRVLQVRLLEFLDLQK